MALNLPDARHQAEAVLLQDYGNLEVQAHGQGTIMIPQTTVNIPAEQLKDNIVWSLFSFVYGNPCCIGLAALIFSVKARDRKMVGDLNGARSYASTAHILNIVSTVLIIIGILLFIIVFFLNR
ncbi:dispanin subfamily A member 2b-like [Cyprinodon tularosa]|uniref:dispanin subfamily A member 2b-like n=1 Tax=Cyprinodon tularosa TaxID=77115 RepID=UPI0018E22FD5|nr:dispanin subfamily A member 2b-like [Cyprinodon tularosa]